MCRSIKTLRRREAVATEEEVRAAALQFVRKVSGYRVPSRANQAVFDQAVDEVAAATWVLLEGLAGMVSVRGAGAGNEGAGNERMAVNE